MSDDRWSYGDVMVDVRGFFSTEHTFCTPEITLASLKVSGGMAEGAYETYGGWQVLIRRSGCLSRSYEMMDGDHVRGAAEPRGFFKQGYVIRFDDSELELVPEGFFQQEWLLVDASGRTLLRITRRGLLSRGAQIHIEQPVEFPLVVLAYYLYATIQQEAGAAAAAS